jgi:hypothetical protein
MNLWDVIFETGLEFGCRCTFPVSTAQQSLWKSILIEQFRKYLRKKDAKLTSKHKKETIVQLCNSYFGDPLQLHI